MSAKLCLVILCFYDRNNNLSELGGRLNNSVRVMSYITKSNNWEEIGVLPFHTGADVYSTAYDSSAEASAAIYIGGTHVKIKAVASNRYINAVITIVCA